MLAVSNNSATDANQSPMVTLDFPAAMQGKVVNALKADPKSVDLRAQASYFYEVGGRVLELFEDEDLEGVLGDVSPYFYTLFSCLAC
jgi:GINS complex subunit 3